MLKPKTNLDGSQDTHAFRQETPHAQIVAVYSAMAGGLIALEENLLGKEEFLRRMKGLQSKMEYLLSIRDLEKWPTVEVITSKGKRYDIVEVGSSFAVYLTSDEGEGFWDERAKWFGWFTDCSLYEASNDARRAVEDILAGKTEVRRVCGK